MKLLKKLAISTFAFAAFSFIACDNPSTPGVGEPDSPDSPVVDAGSKTITVAITADESRISGKDQVYVYAWSDNDNEYGEPFGSKYPGEALTKDETLGIWSITKDVSVDGTWHVIFNDGTEDNKVEGILIKPNESKLYTRARTWIDWDKTSADTTEPYVEPEAPEVPTEMNANIIAFAVDVSNLDWADGAPYIWGWNGNWVDKEEKQTEQSPFYTIVWGSDAVKLTQLEGTTIWYFTFSKDCDTTEGHYVEFISSDKSESARIGSLCPALEAGKGYLLKATNGEEGKLITEWTTFTSFDELKSE